MTELEIYFECLIAMIALIVLSKMWFKKKDKFSITRQSAEKRIILSAIKKL